jgi:hypothetical protein
MNKRSFVVRAASLGGALALAGAGLATTVGLATAGGTAGANTPSYTASCKIAGVATSLPAVIDGKISPAKVSPGGSYTVSGLALNSSLSVKTQDEIKGKTFAGKFVGTVTSTGSTPSSLTVTFTIPATKVPSAPSKPLALVAPGALSGAFTADATGTTSVAVSTGTTGTLAATLNGTSVGAPGPCTQPAELIASAPIATPAGGIKALLPNSGPLAGGTTVKIVGTFLSDPKSVTFGGVRAKSFKALTPTSLMAVAPAGTGSAPVVVTTPSGASASLPFTYTAGPIVTAVSPSTGPPAGGNRVTLTGLQLAGATSVEFGTKAATIDSGSPTSVTVAAPAGKGVVDVTVRNALGVSVTGVQTRYSYLSGYWETAADGGVFTYGSAHFYGSTGGKPLNKPVVGMAGTPDGQGYWLVASDGGIFSYGDAGFYGSTGSLTLNRPIVGMASTPDGFGYWLVASDGGIFSYGDAGFYGSTGSVALNQPIVGMAATPNGGGYWLVAADGGVFAFGDAGYYGSLGGLTLRAPAVGIISTPDGHGYWIVTADGGVFDEGDAAFHGSAGGLILNRSVVDVATSPTGAGYWLAAADGGIFNYGDAAFYGSAGDIALNQPIVGIAAS